MAARAEGERMTSEREGIVSSIVQEGRREGCRQTYKFGVRVEAVPDDSLEFPCEIQYFGHLIKEPTRWKRL